MQDDLQEFGVTLCRSSRHSISINEVFDHLDIPYYPKTSLNGIAHFIHFSTSLVHPEMSKKEVYQVALEQMSKVCSLYT